jgi:hypothetical protein
MQVVGANPVAQAVGLDPQPGVSNYLLRNDPSQWITNVAHYGRIEYQDLYPGINLVYYGNSQTQLEYDFDIVSGASPAAIQLSFQGAQGMMVDSQGNLVLHTAGGDVVEKAPVAYQVTEGERRPVSVQYELEANGQVGFAVGAYDLRQPLLIDPVLSYSTYLGGSGTDTGYGIAVDSAGDAYVTGYTSSTNFPTTAGAFQTTYASAPELFVTKLNASGTALVYSTYLGPADASGIAVNSAGDAYITGSTPSSSFPTTPGACQTSPDWSGSSPGDTNGFVTELNASGSGLVYSTYLGGSGTFGVGGSFDFSGDGASGIALNSAGDAYVTGWTYSTNFPTTAGAFQTTLAGTENTFVTELNASGSALVYSTYLGGNSTDRANGIAVDTAGNAYVSGNTKSSNFPTTAGAFQTMVSGTQNAFLTKLNSAGSALAYSTYLGGSSSDNASGIAVDSADNAYVTGLTTSTNFPITAGTFQTTFSGYSDAFVTKLNSAGSALVYSTYLGGNGSVDGVNGLLGGIALDSSDDAYITGATSSTNFPTTPGAFQTTGGGSVSNAFVTEVNPSGTSLVYSTYLGGSGGDTGTGIAVDNAGNVYLTGQTGSNLPTTAGALQTTLGGGQDAFVAKLAAGLVLRPTTLPAATVAVGYSQTLSAYGGTAPYTFAVTSGSLPAGLSLSSGGVLSGTPTAAGSSSFTVTATDSTGLTGSQAYTFMAYPASFSVSGFPSPSTAGVAGSVTVKALDANGNVVTSYTGTVAFTSSDAHAVLPANYTFTTTDQGVHTLTVTLKTAGTESVTATDTANSSVTGSETGITVNPAAAALLSFSNVPSSTTAGRAFTLTLTAKDAYGNTATGYRGTVKFTSSDAKAVLAANYTFTSSDAGVHNFTVTLETAGAQSVTATDTVTSSITGTASGIVVNPAAAASLSITGLPSTVKSGTAYSFTVTALDAYGNTATGYRGTVKFTTSDKKARVPANYTFTAADNGVHTFTNGVMFKTTGNQTLTATDTVTGTINGTVKVIVSSSPTFVVLGSFLVPEAVTDASGNLPSPTTAPASGQANDVSAVSRPLTPADAVSSVPVAVLDAHFAAAWGSEPGASGNLDLLEDPWWIL